MKGNSELTRLLPYIVDLLISVAWFASFGVFVNAIKGLSCGGAFDWDFGGFFDHDFCARWKAGTAFAFLSAIFWLVSTIVVCLYPSCLASPVVYSVIVVSYFPGHNADDLRALCACDLRRVYGSPTALVHALLPETLLISKSPPLS